MSYYSLETYINDYWKSKIAPFLQEQFSLTDREIQVFEKKLRGKTPLQTSQDLGISKNTVRQHLFNLHRKIGGINKILCVLPIDLQVNDRFFPKK